MGWVSTGILARAHACILGSRRVGQGRVVKINLQVAIGIGDVAGRFHKLGEIPTVDQM